MVVEIYTYKEQQEPFVLIPDYTALLSEGKVLINSIQIVHDTYRVFIYLPNKIIEICPQKDTFFIHGINSSEGEVEERSSKNVIHELYEMIRTFLHEERVK